MKRKVLGIVLAVVLALVGVGALMAYVDKAKDDAVGDVAQVQVYVVDDAIPQGATLAMVQESTSLQEVPQNLVVEGAVTSFDGLDPSLVAAVPLEPGEQLLRTRLVDPQTLTRVAIPEGLQEITVALAPERAVGGALQPGETVGILLSFDPFETNTAGTPSTVPGDTTPTTVARRTPNTTNMTLDQILVTSVQYSQIDSQQINEEATSDTSPTQTTVQAAPSNVLLVTLAVTTAQAEQITFAAEFGHIWLTRQNGDTNTDGSRIITLDQVYVTVPE